MPITVGRGRRKAVTVHGVQGHSGRSRGDHSASKSGRSLCSSPAVCHGSATRGGRPKRRRQQWHPFLVRIYLRCLKPCDPSGPNGCLITLLGCLLSSGWEILVGLKENQVRGRWPEKGFKKKKMRFPNLTTNQPTNQLTLLLGRESLQNHQL